MIKIQIKGWHWFSKSAETLELEIESLNNDTLVATSTASAQIFDSKFHPPKKEADTRQCSLGDLNTEWEWGIQIEKN